MEDLAVIQYNCILNFGGILKLMILLLEEWKIVSLHQFILFLKFQFTLFVILHIFAIYIYIYINQLLYFASSYQGKAT